MTIRTLGLRCDDLRQAVLISSGGRIWRFVPTFGEQDFIGGTQVLDHRAYSTWSVRTSSEGLIFRQELLDAEAISWQDGETSILNRRVSG